MPVQAFVDDSGGKGHTRHFALCGLIGHSEHWAEFSDEWRACLDTSPRIKTFKMREAARRTGQFREFSVAERDQRLRSLAQIINLRPKITTYSVIDLEAHAATFAKRGKPQRDPYFWPYQNTIMAVCHTLWDAGWRERFEIIFDEHVIFGPRVRLWYPIIRKMMELTYPEQASILPIDPMFRSDDEFLPLQAADLFAWCRRDATDKQNDDEFRWLLGDLQKVQETDYSQYYDLERMTNIMKESERIAREGSVPAEVRRLYADTYALMMNR